jgi:polyhydroxybutyrate depolymerase
MKLSGGRRAALTGFAAVLVLVGCTDDSGSGGTPAATGTGSPTSTTTAAEQTCTPAPGYTPGTTTHRLTVGGRARQLLVHLPPEPTADMALVVDFHGAGSDMNQQAVYSGFDPLADEEGFVVATPNGIDAAIRQWRFLGAADEIEFAEALVADLVTNACVDASRVFATGISSGGAMSASLACQASDTFAGFGPVAANFYIEPICQDAKPRPIVIYHGTDDEVVPYAGGEITTGGGLQVQPAEESARRWAEHNGCTGGPEETEVGSEVVRLDWTGCDEPVVLYRIVGGGHTWPGAAVDVARLGPTTQQIDATAEMWEFWNRDS